MLLILSYLISSKQKNMTDAPAAGGGLEEEGERQQQQGRRGAEERAEGDSCEGAEGDACEGAEGDACEGGGRRMRGRRGRRMRGRGGRREGRGRGGSNFCALGYTGRQMDAHRRNVRFLRPSGVDAGATPRVILVCGWVGNYLNMNVILN